MAIYGQTLTDSIEGNMDKPLMFETRLPGIGEHSPARQQKVPQDDPVFNKILSNSMATHKADSHGPTGKLREPTLIGTISKEQPTVSQLLLGNKDLAEKGWDIIYSTVNRDKPYTKIAAGTPVYYSQENGELTWPGLTPIENKSIGQDLLTKIASPPIPLDSITAKTALGDSVQPAVKGRSDSQLLGILSEDSPTVSHLLSVHPQYKERTWGLLADTVNKNKPFNKIPSGTKIYLDPGTNEISWQKGKVHPVTTVARPSTPVQELHSQQDNVIKPPADLTEAVQPYMGKSYKEINCYGLLVRGLKNLGVSYTGKDGLRDRLTSMAKKNGLPSNAYLNGEGIVKVAGSEVLSQSYLKVNDWDNAAGKSFKEMERLLEKGQILSFSTPTKGHTGIISRHNEEWTFINSGRMDNHVASPNSPKEVGEENLIEEIRNWFKTANKNRESLVVTLGQLENNKIRGTINPDFQQTRRL